MSQLTLDQRQTSTTRSIIPGRKEGRPRKVNRSPLGTTLAYAALVVIAAFWLAPIAWALITSFKSETDAAATPVTIAPPHGWTTESYDLLFSTGDVPRWMMNSAIIAIGVTVITLIACTLCAYAFSRLRFPGRGPLYAITIASILVPTQIFIVPLFDELRALGLIDTYWGIILPQTVAPVMVFILTKFFDELPRELEEAALVDGATRLRIFGQILLPLSRPIISAVAVFVFIGAWNNFLLPFIVTNDPTLMTLPVGLQTVAPSYSTVNALRMAQAIIAALPLIIVFIFFQRQIVRSIATTGIGGQ